MAQKVVMMKVAELRPHPLNQVLYGRPTENTAYPDIRADMKRRGFDEHKPLLVTRDGRILAGVTRWAAAKSVGIVEVPCLLFSAASDDTAEEEAERELIRDNVGRRKTELMVAREQRKAKEIEGALARKRMAHGVGEGDEAGKATDKVGKLFNESGKTVGRRLKVLEAIETAEEAGDGKLAARLTELLNAGYSGKALALLDGKPKKAAPVRVDVPR